MTSIVITEMLNRAEIKPRELEKLTDGQIKYNRIRDVTRAQKAPARVSELLLICEATQTPCMQAFADIIVRTRWVQQGRMTIEISGDKGTVITPSKEELESPPRPYDWTATMIRACTEHPEDYRLTVMPKKDVSEMPENQPGLDDGQRLELMEKRLESDEPPTKPAQWLSDEQLAEIVKSKIMSGDLGVVANRDPHKYEEMRGGDGR